MRVEWILIGVLVSLIFYECTRVSPGGLIVPAYLALHFSRPIEIALAVFVMLAAYLLLRLLDRFVILFGRRRFALSLLLSFALGAGLSALGLTGAAAVGFLVPGIAVRDMERQGVLKTLAALGAALGLLALIYMALGAAI